MPKKSKPAETETLSGDILDLLWTHVINPDPGGAWLDEALKNSASAPEPVKTALPAIQRLLATKASREDLGRVARMERYERCFGLLYELDDPGLKSGKPTGLREQLLKTLARGGREKEFMAVVWEGIGEADDEGERWSKTSPKAAAKDEPFSDVQPAVARLINAGAQPRDIELFTRWQRFDATVEALRLFERAGITEVEELLGLHESILGAEPSGKEARPGSWPLPKITAPRAAVTKDPPRPYLVIKGVKSFDFTPDSKGLVVRGKSGPCRIVDAQTGEVRVTLKAAGQLTGWEYTSDASCILVLSDTKNITSCDSKTGKIIKKFVWPAEISSLAIHKVPVGDDFFAVTTTGDVFDNPSYQFYRFDGSTFACVPASSLFPENVPPGAYCISSDGPKLIACYNTIFGSDKSKKLHLAAWSWPELKPLWTALVAPDDMEELQCSPDGRLVAVAGLSGGVIIVDAQTAKVVRKWQLNDEWKFVAFTGDNKHLASYDYYAGVVRIWNIESDRVVHEFKAGFKQGESILVSPDGKILAVGANPGCHLWRLDTLLEGC